MAVQGFTGARSAPRSAERQAAGAQRFDDSRHPHDAAQCTRPRGQRTVDRAQSGRRLCPAENPEARNEDPAARTNQVLPDRSRTARRPAYVLSGTHQRTAQGRAGCAAMVGFGHRKQDDFRQQAGWTKQRRRTRHHPSENRKLHPQNLHPTGCRRSADRGASEASQTTLGCSRHRKPAKCTTRIRWSTSTRRS